MQETELAMEEIQDLELGDNATRWFDIKSVKKPIVVEILDIKAYKTNWGPKAILFFSDGVDICKISNWNYRTNQKLKSADLIGKKIRLSPNDEKTLKLEVI